jgi:serine phosphatase RsbU (regulator of sigma subunit)
MRTYGWRKWSDPLLECGLAVLLGVGITLVEGGGKGQLPPLHTFIRNAILAVSILIDSRGLETMLSWAIEQSRIPTVFRTIIYAFGAWVGFFSGLLVVASLLGMEDDDFRFHSFHFIYSIVAAVLISCIVGFILHHNRKRNDRLRRTIERLKEHEYAEKELEIARSVQQRLLPPQEIDAGAFHVSARTEAAHSIGGDFYDVVRLDDGSTYVLIADVSGKGIAASLIMASCKGAIPFLATSRDPVRVMTSLNQKLCQELQRREFVAMAIAHFDPKTWTGTLVNAGMPDPLLVHADGSVEALSARGDRFPLGARGSAQYAAAHFTVSDGDRLLMYSDGLAEASLNGEPIGYERVHQLAAECETVESLIAAVRAGAQIDDDATGVIITRSADRALPSAGLQRPA